LSCSPIRLQSGTFEPDAIERTGVAFTNGDQPGVRLKKKPPDNLRRIADEGAALLMAFGSKRYLRCVGGNFLD
jgi:hypothetical protein